MLVDAKYILYRLKTPCFIPSDCGPPAAWCVMSAIAISASMRLIPSLAAKVAILPQPFGACTLPAGARLAHPPELLVTVWRRDPPIHFGADTNDNKNKSLRPLFPLLSAAFCIS